MVVNSHRAWLVLRWGPCLGSIPCDRNLFRYVTNQPSKANSAFHPSRVGKWVPALAGKSKAGMVHSVSGCMWGVQVKLWDSLRTRAIPEFLRGVIATRHYMVQIHIYLYLYLPQPNSHLCSRQRIHSAHCGCTLMVIIINVKIEWCCSALVQAARLSEAPGETTRLYRVWQVVPLLPSAAYSHGTPRTTHHLSVSTLWPRVHPSRRPTSSSQRGAPRCFGSGHWIRGEEDWTQLPRVWLPCTHSVVYLPSVLMSASLSLILQIQVWSFLARLD